MKLKQQPRLKAPHIARLLQTLHQQGEGAARSLYRSFLHQSTGQERRGDQLQQKPEAGLNLPAKRERQQPNWKRNQRQQQNLGRNLNSVNPETKKVL